jgi:DNA polymerase/3'-5' exonuclease PolX
MSEQHVSLWAVFIWPAISGVLNVILRTRTPEEWVAMNDRSPRRAAFTRFLRATGLDPVKMVQAIGEFAAGGSK